MGVCESKNKEDDNEARRANVLLLFFLPFIIFPSTGA